MSMLSNNYDLVDGKPVYVEGRGYVNNYENLDNYNKVYSLDENIAMVQDRLDKLLKKKKQGK
jgi:single-stranded DNA-binding protein